MATAISYRSESGDDYLSLYNRDDVDIETIVECEKANYGKEFNYLYVVGIKSGNVNIHELEQRLDTETFVNG